MNDARFLRAPHHHAAFHEAGAKVAVVTAKDKLRALLGNGLDIRAAAPSLLLGEGRQGTLAENGIEDVLELVGMPLPTVYSRRSLASSSSPPA